MTSDLREALRSAAASEPLAVHDLDAVVRAATSRVRRRRLGAFAAASVAVGLLSAGLLLPEGSDPEPEPLPVAPVRVHLEDAGSLDLDVLASRRVTWREPVHDLSHDRFEGLTADGLVLRSRYEHDNQRYSVGLLDPGSGRTDWLPPPAEDLPDLIPVELSAERLTLLTYRSMIVYDRSLGSWTSLRLPVPEGADVHGWPHRAEMGPDGRAYVMGWSDSHGAEVLNPGPRWWSVPPTPGAALRAEPAYDGHWVSWRGSVRVIAAPDGRVVVSSDDRDRVLATAPPEDCTPPPGLPAQVGWAGDRPVVTHSCGEDSRGRTFIYGAVGEPPLEVRGAAFVVGDEQHVVLRGGGDEPATYVLDLERLRVERIGTAGSEGQAALVGGLVLWNESGPAESRRVYDEVWKVARLG